MISPDNAYDIYEYINNFGQEVESPMTIFEAILMARAGFLIIKNGMRNILIRNKVSEVPIYHYETDQIVLSKAGEVIEKNMTSIRDGPIKTSDFIEP